MSDKKILFINKEISPYVPMTHMSKLGNEMPKVMADAGWEMRAFLPKWGNVNERRNQLHEVIRLSGMNIIINDTDHPLIIKVATLASAHIQVYFIDNDDFFRKRLMNLDKNNEEYKDNYERAIFYARSVIETTKLLRWFPNVILCQGWVSSLAPFYLKTAYNDEPCYQNAKIVYVLHNDTLQSPLPDNFVDLLTFRNVTPETIKGYGIDFKSCKDLQKFAINFCDAVICAEPSIDKELIGYAKEKGLPVLEYSDDKDLEQRSAAFFDTLI